MRSFCLWSFCEQDYWKSNEPISLKLGIMVRKNWLTFGGAPVPDTDSGSLFHFPDHCGIGDFRFVSISHRQFVTKLGKMTEADKVMYPQRSEGDLVDIRIQINPAIRFRIPDHFWLNFGIGGGLCYLSTCSVSIKMIWIRPWPHFVIPIALDAPVAILPYRLVRKN